MKGEVHREYQKQLRKEKYKGESYVVDEKYWDPVSKRFISAGGLVYGAPDGRTRRILRDLNI